MRDISLDDLFLFQKVSILFMTHLEEERAYWFATVCLSVGQFTNSLCSFSSQEVHFWNEI